MKFDGVFLYVKDLERSIDFYRSVLRLEIAARPATHFAVLQMGEGKLYLHKDPDRFSTSLEVLNTSTVRGHGLMLHFQVDDVDQTKQQCEMLGREISFGPVDQEFGQRQLYLYDPDGYNIVLWHPIS